MKLEEKAFFRIYAYHQLMDHSDHYKMSLVLNRAMDYKTILSHPDRVHRRVSNLVWGADPDKNLIFFRPLEIREEDHVELTFQIQKYMPPIYVEIGANGTANDIPEMVIVINHTDTAIRFTGSTDHTYEVSVDRAGETLETCWKAEDLVIEHPEELQDMLVRAIRINKEACMSADAQLIEPAEKADLLEKRIGDLKEELEKLEKKERSVNDRIRTDRAQIAEKEKLRDEITKWLPHRRRRLDEMLEDLKRTPGDRKRLEENYQNHIHFLSNIERFYKEQEKDGEFAEILQTIKAEAKELETYFLKLDELEKENKAEEEGNDAGVESVSENISGVSGGEKTESGVGAFKSAGQ